MPIQPSNSLLGLNLQELTNLALGTGQPAYRGQQLFDALYRQKIDRLDQVSTLPLEYRARLAEQGWEVGFPTIARKFISSDGTVRYLVELADGETVETVWMPEGDGGESGDGSEAGDEIEVGTAPSLHRGWRRATICVSSQVGCAVNCKFCFTALLGVKRNLEAGEIVGQIAAVLREQGVEPPLQRVNIVFMGMGEPFLNYDNFMKSVRLLAEGVGIPESRMTVSTAGIVPRIHDFGQETLRPKLAISLNGSNDALRSEVMPLNRKWNLGELMKAAREVPLRGGGRLTFEYVLLGDVNEAPEQAGQAPSLHRRRYEPLRAAARCETANEERLAELVATCSSMRKARLPGVEGCKRRPPCSSTMRQQALSERVEGLFPPSELSGDRYESSCDEGSPES